MSSAVAAPSAVKAAPRAALKGSATALPDRIGAFYTFGRKKVGASLLALVKGRERAAPKKGGSSPPAAAPKAAAVSHAAAAVSGDASTRLKAGAGAAGVSSAVAAPSVVKAAPRAALPLCHTQQQHCITASPEHGRHVLERGFGAQR